MVAAVKKRDEDSAVGDWDESPNSYGSENSGERIVTWHSNISISPWGAGR